MLLISFLVVVCVFFVAVNGFIDVNGKYKFDPMEGAKAFENGAKIAEKSLNENILTSTPSKIFDTAAGYIATNAGHLQFQVQNQIADAISSSGLQIPNSLDFQTAMQPFFLKIQEQPYLAAPLIQLGILVVLSAFIATAELTSDDGRGIYKTGRYSPQDAEAYYSDKPLVFIKRALEIAAASTGFGLSLLTDFVRGKLTDPAQEAIRAEQLTTLLTDLGPTFIKIGQSLSVRTDLLRPAYILGLSALQDRVPPFSTSEARSLIAKELGSPVDEIFFDITPTSTVIAAASLGQVYKARLKSSDEEVAVKVQRPGIIEQVSLDMHILRTAAPIAKQAASLQSDLLGIIDDWGYGFVDELDYRREADNADIFMTAIQTTPFANVVFAPTVIREQSSSKVLTTGWVEGERLETSNKEDRTKLCSIAMNTYLTMMLESPILHADPHPGNLRKTPDGRLCIMDWGLVTSLSPNLQLTFIDHISHLVSKDYAEVPNDLVKLGFIPSEMEEVALESGVVEVLADIYGQWARGGGAAKVDVASVITQLNGLTTDYGNLFKLPPYFAYIARAFGVLEGIGLAADENYAIVNECLPYIAQRLLKEPGERSGAALSGFIFGKDKNNVDSRVVDVERVELLVKGLSNYNTAAEGIVTDDNEQGQQAPPVSPFLLPTGPSDNSSSRGSDSSNTPRVQQIEEVVNAVTSIIFDQPSEGAAPTPLQSILLEEVAKVVGAVSRSQWNKLRERSGPSRVVAGRTRLGVLVDPLGLFSDSALVNADAYDNKVLDTMKQLLEVLREAVNSDDGEDNEAKSILSLSLDSLSQEEQRQVSILLTRILWQRRDEVARLSGQLLGTVLRQASKRQT